jgi:putative selenium metabolism protein SsnA
MLITNGTLITFGAGPRVIPGGAVYYEYDTILEVGSTAELTAKYPGAEVLDAQGKVVMPGLMCGHTHFYGAFARGMAIPGEAPANFPEILERLWWRIDRALTREDCYFSALVCLVDAIRHGTTTLIDHHASPNAIDGSLDAIAGAVKEAGVRASLCYEVTDRPLVKTGDHRNGDQGGARAGIAENARFIRQLRRDPHPRLGASFGLHASLTLSDETLAACVGEARDLGVGFHIHVAEDMADQRDSLKKYGLRVVERLEKHGVLGAQTIAVHCVNLDGYEKETLRATHTHVTHQPRSNMNNAVGVADVAGMLQRGINVALGNDGFSNNMFTEMHVAYLLHKLNARDPRAMPANMVTQIAFDNNTRLAGLFWSKPVGMLAPGALADIILLDTYPFTPLTGGNFPWHIIFGMDGSQVTHTICGGQVLMCDRRLLTLDEAAIAARANELAKEVWRRASEI